MSWRKARARANNYFWLPCPLCGQEFGGDEAWGTIRTTEPGLRTGICPQCTWERQEAAERALETGQTTVDSRYWRQGRWIRHQIPQDPISRNV